LNTPMNGMLVEKVASIIGGNILIVLAVSLFILG